MSDDLRRILTASDRNRGPTPQELSRIRANVFGEEAKLDSGQVNAASGLGQADDVLLLPIEPRDETKQRPFLFRAAAVLLLIASAVAVAVTTTDAGDQNAATRTPPSACASVPNLVEALEAWRGVDNWARLAVTDPDLGHAVLAVTQQLGDDDEVQRAMLGLEALAKRSDEGRNVGARRAAVVGGIELIVARLDAFDEPGICDLTALRDVGR